MKKYRNRPAIPFHTITNMVMRGSIQTTFMHTRGLFVFRLTKGCHVYQTWISLKNKIVTHNHARTYLRKGIFLIPIWLKVSDWQMAYYKQQKTDLASISIYKFDNQWYKACYMQVDDIDRAIRQQEHISNRYQRIVYLFTNIDDVAYRVIETMRYIDDRRQTLCGLKKRAQGTLSDYSYSLQSIINNSPLFASNNQNNKTTISIVIQRIINGCKSDNLYFNPIYRRLYGASLSLQRALFYIEKNDFKRAKERIEKALENLEYPDPV